MGKPSGGGPTGAAIFTTSVSGPPPGSATTGTLSYIDLGAIPAGQKIWFGSTQFGSPDKSVTFELRTNNAGASAGNDAATALLSATAASPRSGTKTTDLYKGGTLHVVSVVGTGPEKIWLALKSKTASAGAYIYSVNYTVE